MSVWRFLKDRIGLILTFAVVIGFSAASVRLGESRARYILLTGGVIVCLYLLVSGRKAISHANRVKRASEQSGADWVYALPEPETGGQRVYHDALKKLAGESDARLADAKAKSAEELEFLTLWVHEIKTPIAAAKLLIESGLENPDERTLYAVGDELGRIEDKVQQSLFYVRAGEFAADCRIDRFALERAVTSALQNEFANIGGRQIRLVLSGLEAVVDSDEKWIAFIIKQLLDNAVKYSPVGGTVRIAAERDGAETRLTVSDEGAGIRPEDLRRIFQKSFTGENGRSYYNSTGIGLYLASQLSDKLGHALTVSSQIGKGTAFTLHIRTDEP